MKSLSQSILFALLLLLPGCSGKHAIPSTPGIEFTPPFPGEELPALPASSARYFEALAHETESGTDSSHYLTLLDKGDEALLARIHLIRSAKHSIRIQTFIWSDDPSGRFLMRELLKAARRGVDVEIIIDQYPNQGPPEIKAFLARADDNLSLKLYNPTLDEGKNSAFGFSLALLQSFKTLNQRMHNKLLLVDDTFAITGGRNIQNKYFDRDPKYTFRDRDTLLIGETVKELRDSFFTFWNSELSVNFDRLADVGQVLESHEFSANIASFLEQPVDPIFADIDRLAEDEAHVRAIFHPHTYEVTGNIYVFADLPGKAEKEDDALGEKLQSAFQNAERSIILQTPYLIFTPEARKLLRSVRKRNPEIELIASTNSLAAADHLHVYAIAIKQRKHLLKKLGFRIYEFKPHPGDAAEIIGGYNELLLQNSPGPVIAIHAKSFVIDDSIGFVGSHNFDPRSANYNTELGLVIEDEGFVQALKASIIEDIAPQNSWRFARSKEVPIASYFAGFLQSVSRALPLFDIYPFQYGSCYELKPDMKPLYREDPRFHEHYEWLGAFPETKNPVKATQALLLRSMGGVAEPLM